MPPLPSYERPQEYVARQLRQAILDGEYAPGERLPIERELSEQFGVSRSAIRQALLILSHQGLVKVRSGAGGGPFVTRGSLPAAIAAFENVLISDPAAVEEFVQAKLIIEPAITGHVASSISAESLDLLRHNVAEFRKALRRKEDPTELALEFHSIIIRSSDNRYLSVILQLIGQTLDRLPAVPESGPVNQRQVLRDHEQLIEALERHDAEEARQLTTDHLEKIWHGRSPAGRKSRAGATDRLDASAVVDVPARKASAG